MADKNMFLDEYVFKGLQCDKVIDLVNLSIDSASETKIFNSVIELFIFSALVGCFFNRKAKPDKDKSRTKKIFAGQFNTHITELKLVFKFVMLTAKYEAVDDITRLNKTFRNPETDENYAEFEEYMLGGLEEIHERLILDTNKVYTDYLTSINKLLSDIKSKKEEDTIIPSNDDFF